MTRSEEGKLYRARQKQALGAQVFNASEALKRKIRRHNSRPAPVAPVAIPVELKEPEQKQQPQAVDITLDAIYDAKKQFAEASGHTIKKASVATALNRIKRLHKYIFKSEMLDFEWVKKTSVVSEFISTSDKWKSSESRIQQYASLSSVLKVLVGYDKEYEFYSKKSVELRRAKDKIDDLNLLSAKEKKNILPWSEIKQIKGDNEYERALIGVYVLTPPRRAKDFGLMRLATPTEELDDDFNYVILNARSKPISFIYNAYKTSNKYGKQTFEMPKALATVLKNHIESAGLQYGDFLFGKSKTEPYSSFSSQITKVFKKHTDRNISVNILRHAYIIEFLKRKDLTLAEKKHTSAKMAHSLILQMKYNRVDS
jgi:hypothetical protein